MVETDSVHLLRIIILFPRILMLLKELANTYCYIYIYYLYHETSIHIAAGHERHYNRILMVLKRVKQAYI